MTRWVRLPIPDEKADTLDVVGWQSQDNPKADNVPLFAWAGIEVPSGDPVREALVAMEAAVNESVSSQREVGIGEWLELLRQAQAALDT